MQSFKKPDLTDDEYDALYRNPNTAVVKNLMTKYALTPQQSENLNERFLTPVMSHKLSGGKRYTRRGSRKDMKPLHKSMHKLRHRGRGGKRRSCKKY
jgi:hypothetical protein